MIPSITKNIITPSQAKPNANNAIVLAVVLLIASGLVYWFFILPKQTEINTEQAKIDSLGGEKKKYSELVGSLNKLNNSLRSNAQNNDRLDEILPLNGKTFNLERLLNNLAGSINVTVGNITVTSNYSGVAAGDVNLLKNPYAAKRTLQKISGSIYITGTFDQLEQFLRKIESSGRILDVTSLEITADKNNTLGLKLSINAYYLAP